MTRSQARNWPAVLALCVACLRISTTLAQFTADDVNGRFIDPFATPGDDYFDAVDDDDDQYEYAQAPEEAPVDDGAVLTRPILDPLGTGIRLCGCSAPPSRKPSTDDIRAVSNAKMSAPSPPNPFGLSNLVWAFAQLLDHDLVLSPEEEDAGGFEIELSSGGKKGGRQRATMTLQRLVLEREGQCGVPVALNTPHVDAGIVYGANEGYLQNTLRRPGSCKLRTSAGEFLPVTTLADERGLHFFLAGDVRVDEHAMLTAMHTVWMREHNRLCNVVGRSSRHRDASEDEKFELVRKIVGAKMQHITLNEFLPALGITETDVMTYSGALSSSADMAVEFSVAAYRFGHDLVPDRIGKFKTVELFNGKAFYNVTSAAGPADPKAANRKMSDLLNTAARTRADKLDGNIADVLRNTLFGAFGEDLGSRNLFRGRDAALVTYSEMARCYGVEPNAEIARDLDEWPFIALLRDNPDDEPLGPTLRAILTEQFHRVFFGPRGDFWMFRLHELGGFDEEVRKSTIGDIIRKNSDAKVPKNAFKA